MMTPSKRKSYDSWIIILQEYQRLLHKGMIRDIPDNHKYLMEKREKIMKWIFNSNELSFREKIGYLLSTAKLEHSFRFSSLFIISRYWHRIRKPYANLR